MGNDKGLRMTLCQRGERHGFAEAIFAEARQHDSFRVKTVAPITTEEYPTPAKRPANSALHCSLIEERFGIRTKPWHESLTRADAAAALQ